MRDKQGTCVTNVMRSAEDENSVTDEVQNPKMSVTCPSDNSDTVVSSNKK